MTQSISDTRGVLTSDVESKRTYAKILLLDGYSTRTLACVRSWGRRGIPFAVGGESRWDMSVLSRYAKERFVYTSPKRDLSQFIEDVNHYCKQFRADAVFPTSEAAILACSKHRGDLAAPPIIPRECDINIIFSKAKTLEIARSVGILTPRTVHITPNTFHTLDQLDLTFPVVIKSESSSVMLKTRAGTSDTTVYASTRNELRTECASRLEAGQAVLLQEFIDGYGVGISGLFAQGRPIALIGHRRIRESNPLGGPSALAESIPIDPGLLKTTTDLLAPTGYTGPAMVEYKIDRRNGLPYLMEINGRFWGTTLLAPAAGLDLPYLYWKMLNSLEVMPEETIYGVGIKGRYLVGDFRWLLRSLKGKPVTWPGEFPGRISALKSFVSSFFDRRTTELILTPHDPVPFLGRLLQEIV